MNFISGTKLKTKPPNQMFDSGMELVYRQQEKPSSQHDLLYYKYA